MNDSRSSTHLGVHLHNGKIEGVIDHQSHKHSGGPYPVVTLEFGGFAFTLYPGRGRALELADVLISMAADLRAGAEIYTVSSLET